LNFYYDSRGSLSETKNHLIYGHRVGYFDQLNRDDLTLLIDDTRKEMNMLISSLEKNILRKL
jgi:four helix bundle protein